VERLNDNTFAYAAGMPKNGGAETLSLITIEENEINVETVGVLPVAGNGQKKVFLSIQHWTKLRILTKLRTNCMDLGDWYMVNCILVHEKLE
jgi:hypothetical protein